jgi:DNA-binding transcriptional ArsR family regulator
MSDDDDQSARARALASPLRMRILRICLHEAHTNKEIAAALDLNPGSTLHHVRTLVDTGFLKAEEPRRGRRGAREVPYLATRRSWTTRVSGISGVLIETFLQEIAPLAPDDVQVSRLGLKLNDAHREELERRFYDLLQEYAAIPADPDGAAISIMLAIHPEA